METSFRRELDTSLIKSYSTILSTRGVVIDVPDSKLDSMSDAELRQYLANLKDLARTPGNH